MGQRSRKPIPYVFYTEYAADYSVLTFSKQALLNGVTVTSVLTMVREARKRGLKAPVLFMGYYNPMLSYGEERLLKDCLSAGVNGFIIVDLPPEEAVTFRNFCTKGG
jgi:tryptophan synthase